MFYELAIYQDSQVFFHKTASQLDGPQYILAPGVFLARCRTLRSPLLNCTKFLSSYFSSLLMFLRMAAQLSGVSANTLLIYWLLDIVFLNYWKLWSHQVSRQEHWGAQCKDNLVYRLRTRWCKNTKVKEKGSQMWNWSKQERLQLDQHPVTECLGTTTLERKHSVPVILPPQVFRDQETRAVAPNHRHWF